MLSTPPSASTHLIPASAQRPADDPIFALNAEATLRAKAGEAVINATLGALMDDQGRLATLPSVFEALRRVPPEQAAAYAPIAGTPRFLKAVIADLFGERELARQSVAVATPGGTGALHHAIVNFLELGQALLTPSFYWGPYQTLAEHTRRGVRTFEMFDARGGFHLEALERGLQQQLAAQGRALLLLNTPCNNPTGYALDVREWGALAEIVERASERGSVAVLLDYAYARFAAADSACWQTHAERIAEHALFLTAWTASKSYAQYGARVGALVATHPDAAERARIQNALSFSCRGTWSNCNHAGMLAIAELLEDQALRARIDAEREPLRQLLARRVATFNQHALAHKLSYPRYEGGFFVTVFCADAQRSAALMRERGVFVVPMQGGLRVALCSTREADVPRLVEALAAAVEVPR